jgi:thiol-disulfide isomerase/thioredoxin
MLWGGLAVVVATILGVAVSFQSSSGGSATEFRMVAYQGADLVRGEEVDLSEFFSHGKPVVLNFWAGLCPPCRAEMPGFQRVYDDHGDEFILVGVDVGPFVGLGSHDDARQFLEEFDISYPAVYTVAGDPVIDYRVLAMPTTVFLTPDRAVFYRRTGFLSEDQLRSILADLLDVSSP